MFIHIIIGKLKQARFLQGLVRIKFLYHICGTRGIGVYVNGIAVFLTDQILHTFMP